MDIRYFLGGGASKPKVEVDLTGSDGDGGGKGVDQDEVDVQDIEIELDDDDELRDDPEQHVKPTKTKSPRKTTPRKSKAKKERTPGKKDARVLKSTSPPLTYVHPGSEEAMRLVREAMKAIVAPEAQEKYAEDLVFQEIKGIKPPDEPRNPGKGPVPVGHPDCLTGLTFVVSGVLESMGRGAFEDFVRRHGGRVTSAVSGKSDFLVVGDKVGRSKVESAAEKGVDLITEDGVWQLVAATSGLVDAVGGAGAAETNAVEQAVAKPAANANTSARAGGKSGAKTPVSKNQDLWVDKYKPKTSADLVGNNQMVSNLKSWLSTWDSVHLHHSSAGGEMKKRGKVLENKKAVYVFGLIAGLLAFVTWVPVGSGHSDAQKLLNDLCSATQNRSLLSGSPGIGKTSAALIVARECGYEPIEVNASDTRSKSDNKVGKGVGGKLSNMIREMSTNSAFSFQKTSLSKSSRHVLIMDEVDGMSGGDRGGVADLIQTIKNSKVPIICICNDKYSQKLKSLRNHTIELDFAKPTAAMITKRLRMICQGEGLQMNDATMNAVIQNANGGDIRLILGTLQMIRRRTDHLSYDDAKGAANTKDVEISPFQAAQNVLSDAAYSFSDRLDFCFQDMDLVPLLVQENYLNHNPSMAVNAVNRLKVVAKAADCFSEGDTISRCVRQNQNWNLLPAALAIGTVMPATYAKGRREVFGLYPGENNFPRFSAWLGQNSSNNKCKRLLGELHTDMISSGNFHADRTSLRLDYCGVLKTAIIQPLVKKEKEGVGEAIALMNEYALKRDDLDALIDLTKFKTKAAWAEDAYKTKVATAVKTAFTRTFNAQGVRVKNGAVLKDAKVSKKRKASGGAGDDDDDDGLNLDDGVMAVDDEDEDVDDVDTDAIASKLGKKGVSLELKAKKNSKGGTTKKAAAKKKKKT